MGARIVQKLLINYLQLVQAAYLCLRRLRIRSNLRFAKIVQLAHLTSHAQTSSLSRLQRNGPPFRIANWLSLPIQAQNLHQLRDLRMISGRLHPVAPGHLFLFIEISTDNLLAVVNAIVERLHGSLILRSGNWSRQVQWLEQEFTSNLSLIARLQGKALTDLLQALTNAVQSAFPHALLHISRSLAHSKRLDHSQFVEEFALGICVNRERAVGCFGVHVDQGRVAASHDDDESANWKLE